MMKFTIEVRHGEVIPEFYGAAYQDYDRAVVICALFPLNHLIGWKRNLWWLIWHCRTDWAAESYRKLRAAMRDEESRIYQKGFLDGQVEVILKTGRQMGKPQTTRSAERIIEELKDV